MRRVLATACALAGGWALVLAVACGDSGSATPTADGSLMLPPSNTDSSVRRGDDDAEARDSAAPPLDASPGLPGLFGFVGGFLGRFDLATGLFLDIGDTGKTSLTMAWDAKNSVMRVVTDPGTAPAVGTIDLCTGTITAGPPMKVGSKALALAEGLAYEPKAALFYASIDADHDGGSSSEALGSVDMGSGATTGIGAFNPAIDGDALTFVGSTLYGLDIQTKKETSSFYKINITSAAAKLVINVNSTVMRLAYDSSRDVLFVATGSPDKKIRRAAQMDRTTGTLTPVGSGLPETLHPGVQIGALASAPLPTCP